MRFLVTGGAGFIGSNYVHALLSGAYPGFEDVTVTVLDKLTYAGRAANLAFAAHDPAFTFVRGDITDGDLLRRLLPGHDVVVNFAAESHVDRSIHDAAGFVDTNVAGTQRLLQAAVEAEVRTFLQVSTDEVYGSIEEGSWPETDPLLPNSPYSASKAGADLLCHAYHRTYGLDVRVTRCANNYGPRQFPEKVIPRFITNLLDGRRIPLYGDGGNVREWLHVDDHCRAIQLVLQKGDAGETYNIGGGAEMTNLELTERLLAAHDAGWDMVEYVEDRPGHDRRYALDTTKVRGLGYRPEVDFDEGIAATVRWYADNEAWWRPLIAHRRNGLV
ncbi:dTDP-glucose 4,6-dehydratase [Actinoallomurus rhizosphaericola]|uniref:dTDP-glucose 4,6-dehydratase n=1 Tax=Actinoallomurus rhizosphaericola TaxID=2952536 RepID=UPI0020933476|nr:dTDP-glucose 4,6-dehydratase [Actinoallomurus rhizosphaericola]MCO5998410.1 dTDP-glucose 4,6-dehydratase [Actinoallomurus rhizosphaericola]